MYTRRAALITLSSLRRGTKLCRRDISDYRCSIESSNLVRRYRAATESADVCTNSDGFIGENQSGNMNYYRNDQFYGGDYGGVDRNQNPSRVYGQIGTERIDFSNTFRGGSGVNDSGGNSPSFDSRIYHRKMEDDELNRIPDRLLGWNSGEQLGNGAVQMNSSSNGFGNGGRLDTPPQNLARAGFYGGNEKIPANNIRSSGFHPQNDARFSYSNEGNHQRSLSESHNAVRMDSPMSTGLALDAGSVEVSKECEPANKPEDLDQLTREGKLKEAVELLGLLEKQSIQVGLPRYMELVKACGENEALAEAKSIHELLVKSFAPLEVRTYNQILEMYSKCGSMKDAFAVFDQMPTRNMTSWDIMISWLAKNGHAESSLELFDEFKQSSGLRPDGQMFHGVFSACGVVCDTIEGMLHFESMTKDYGIVPSMEDYVSIVEMLGSAGCLDEALEFIQKMPVEPSIEIWETMMKFSRFHGNVVLGDQCAELIELLDPLRLNEQSRSGLIPLNASDLDKEKEKEKKRNSEGSIEPRHRVSEFRAGDRSHPHTQKLYGVLWSLKEQLKEAGYTVDMRCVLHDIDPESKEEALMAHSERLAVVHGFLNSPARADVRIMKNLRVCTDCHNVFKIISKIVGRVITARDSKRFHHFRNGSCSCNDYW